MKKANPATDYLAHMLEAIERIDEYVCDMSEPAFLADRRTQDAVVRNFEVLGEASRNVAKHHPDFAAQHPEIPWGVAWEMRNALAHGYFKVDYEVVWKTIQTDLPKLAVVLRQLIAST